MKVATALTREGSITAPPSEACGEWAIVKAALEGLCHATLICRSTADVVVANDTAFGILERQDGICLRTGRLAVRDQLTQQKLRRVLSDTEAAADEDRAALLVPRPSGEPPYQMIVRRLQVGSLRSDGEPDSLWSLTIADPRVPPTPPMWAVAALYRFTPAETRLAARLAAGDDPEEIAQQLGVKITTVRSQLASVFAKTGTRRQAQLVRLLSVHLLR
ncbi:MAG TPA: helix-turn-helix transcriptional regulator [Burkholderiales bacterium]|nr:helix-turn-helix transcriptional regulator [Burkholderiales bacterium]